MTAQEFENIAKAILKIDSFTFGKAAVDILVVLFGVPVCALLTKRFVPGLKAISDDIVIPAATSGAVVYLAKSKSSDVTRPADPRKLCITMFITFQEATGWYMYFTGINVSVL